MAVQRDSSPIVGIDLGTTNSLVAWVKQGVPEVLEARGGGHLVPSVVAFDPESGEPVVGAPAKRKKARDALSTVFSVKRLLGRGFADTESFRSELPYELVPGEGPVRIRLGSRELTAVEVSALILRELRTAAREALGTDVHRAVITVPAYFNDAQRQATRTAGRLAGWEVLRIVNEPTAAALAYGLDRKREGKIAVFDLGGGTFDVSILKLRDGIFEVLATNGNTRLGGDDLDQLLVSECVREIESRFGFNPRNEPEVNALLIETCERAKIDLSQSEQVSFEIDLGRGRGRYAKAVTLSEFEALARPVLEATRAPCLQALADAGLELADLSDVVLVGGPTRLRVVQDVAASIFGRRPNTSMHPDEVVAAGAAIQADILAGNNPDLLLLDVVPLSLGIETYGGLMTALIPRNSRIPCSAREHFTTFVDNQTAVDVHVLQGERERVSENRSLARFKLRGIPPQPAGAPRIEVLFQVDADGILQVSAKDRKTGAEQSIEVRPSFGLSDGEVEAMIASGLEARGSDLAFRILVEAKNQVEPLLRVSEARLPEARALLQSEEVAELEQRLAGLRTSLAGSDVAAIRDAAFHLDRATVKLAELMLTKAMQDAKAAGSGSAPRD